MGMPEAQCWAVQPLLDAGLGLEEIERLVCRLAFDAVVGRGTLEGLAHLAEGEAPEVRAAWTRSLSRMLDDAPMVDRS
jgi:hypothetical protein